MGDRYPYFQGESGSRVGAGLLAVVQALCIALFQLLSKVLVLVAMLVLRLMVMTAPAVAVVAILKPDILPALLRVAGAAIVNTLVVGALAGLHALLVVSLFRPGAGIDLWLALLVTGVVTVVLWAVARPFRRLVSMVSLTREQFGGIVPEHRWRADVAGLATAARRRDRRPAVPVVVGAAARRGRRPPDPDGDRPEAAANVRIPGQATAPGPGAARVGSPAPARSPLAAAHRPALPAGPSGRPRTRPAGPVGPQRGRPGRVDAGRSTRPTSTPAIDEPLIYRRPDAVPLRPGGARPAQAELVDGETVYRIYRPGPAAPCTRRRGVGLMPIRSPHGRAAAYRALWQWPLRSPRRLGVTVLLVLVLGGAASYGISTATAGWRAGGSSGVAARPTASTDAAPAPTALPPVPALEPRTLPLSQAPPAALDVAGAGPGPGCARHPAPPPASGWPACAPRPPTSTWVCWPVSTRRTCPRPASSAPRGRCGCRRTPCRCSCRPTGRPCWCWSWTPRTAGGSPATTGPEPMTPFRALRLLVPFAAIGAVLVLFLGLSFAAFTVGGGGGSPSSGPCDTGVRASAGCAGRRPGPAPGPPT